MNRTREPDLRVDDATAIGAPTSRLDVCNTYGYFGRYWQREHRQRAMENTMADAVIVSTARTPIGRAFKGTLVDVAQFVLGEHVVKAAVERSGLDPMLLDDIILAESMHGGGGM